MTDPRKLERALSAAVAIAVAAVAWAPQIILLWSQPYVVRVLQPVSLAMGLLAMALAYEAVERILQRGKGVYAAVVFSTIPAVCVAAGDPASLPLAALLLFASGTLFLAARATGEERPFMLVMLGVLLLVAGGFFGFHALAFGILAAACPAVVNSRRPLPLALVLVLCYAAGALTSTLALFPLPSFASSILPRPLLPSALSLLPWTFFLIPVLLSLRARPPVLLGIAPLLLIALVIALLAGNDLTAVAAAFAPTLSLLVVGIVDEDFAAPARVTSARMIPAVLTAVLLLTLVTLSASGVLAKPKMGALRIAAAIVLGVALGWSVVSRLPRWGFVFLAVTGIILAVLIAQREPLFPQTEDALQAVAWPFAVLVFLACVAAAVTATLIQQRYSPRRVERPDQSYQFAEDNLRLFSGADVQRVPLPGDPKLPLPVAVFGDVTGAESLFATRHGGSLMFRELASALAQLSPAFAVSLGDLAREASPFAYARLRRLLRRISVPLMVTPGNHDLFLGEQYHAAHFHRLFGADNSVFEIGPVRFVILNNAWGFVADEQFAWLESALAGPRPFTLVFCHKPVFELRTGVFYAMETRDHAERLHAIFRERGVTAVFSGHIHSLLHETRDNVTYIISGGGGSKLTTADDRYHFLLLDASADAITVRALELPFSRSAAPLLELHFSPQT